MKKLLSSLFNFALLGVSGAVALDAILEQDVSARPRFGSKSKSRSKNNMRGRVKGKRPSSRLNVQKVEEGEGDEIEKKLNEIEKKSDDSARELKDNIAKLEEEKKELELGKNDLGEKFATLQVSNASAQEALDKAKSEIEGLKSRLEANASSQETLDKAKSEIEGLKSRLDACEKRFKDTLDKGRDIAKGIK